MIAPSSDLIPCSCFTVVVAAGVIATDVIAADVEVAVMIAWSSINDSRCGVKTECEKSGKLHIARRLPINLRDRYDEKKDRKL